MSAKVIQVDFKNKCRVTYKVNAPALLDAGFSYQTVKNLSILADSLLESPKNELV